MNSLLKMGDFPASHVSVPEGIINYLVVILNSQLSATGCHQVVGAQNGLLPGDPEVFDDSPNILKTPKTGSSPKFYSLEPTKTMNIFARSKLETVVSGCLICMRHSSTTFVMGIPLFNQPGCSSAIAFFFLRTEKLRSDRKSLVFSFFWGGQRSTPTQYIFYYIHICYLYSYIYMSYTYIYVDYHKPFFFGGNL